MKHLFFAVRTALVALIAFMPTNPDGALGSLDYTKEERRKLAIKSREAAPKFGTPERQKLMDEVCCMQMSCGLAFDSLTSQHLTSLLLMQIHQDMLSTAPPVPQLTSPQSSDDNLHSREGETEGNTENDGAVAAIEEHQNPEPGLRIVEDVHAVHVNANAGPLRVSFTAGLTLSRQVPAVGPSEQQQRLEVRDRKNVDDRLFTWAAVGLTLAIAFLLMKKFMKASGYTS